MREIKYVVYTLVRSSNISEKWYIILVRNILYPEGITYLSLGKIPEYSKSRKKGVFVRDVFKSIYWQIYRLTDRENKLCLWPKFNSI